MSATGGQAFQLAGLLPYLIPLLAAAAMGLMFLTIRHALEAKANGGSGGSASGPPEAAALERPASRPLLQSIKLASVQLRRLVAGGAGVYEVPWVVVVGAGGAELERLLPAQLAWPPDLARAHQSLLSQVGRISFCRTGAVLGFNDGLLDGSEWRQRWQSLVRALQTCRPERPLDGLVVVIRASELSSSADSHDRLVARGDQLYHLIWSIQRMTGWRIPVYLLVSGCEELAGFADWVLALPRPARQQLLGWSVPYAIDSAFEPKWVDEGIEEVSRQLSVAQLLLMMPEPEVEVAEGLLLFPGETQRLAAPLSVLLTSMLRASAYHEAFMFRGFFLAGRIAGEVAQQSNSAAFAEAVFTDKVFAEHRLAQPAYGEATRKHRQIRIAQIALAIVAFICLLGVMHIRQLSNDYFPSVSTLLSQIDQQVNARVLQSVRPRPEITMKERERNAASMLDTMAKIRVSHIDTIAAPTSLLTFADARVEQAIAVGYRVTVLRAAYNVLTEPQSLAEILDPPRLPGAAVPTSQQALATAVTETIDYDKHLQLYQGIATRPSIGDLELLMEYALDIELPPGFTENYQLYEVALRNVGIRPIRILDVQPVIEQILQERSDAAIKEAYTASQLVALVRKLGSLAGSEPTVQESLSATPSRNLLADTHATLDRISDLLVLPSYDWLSGRPSSVSPLLPLEKLKGLQVVRADFIDRLLASGAKAEADTRNWLLHATAFDSAPVLASNDGAVTLSPSMAASHRLLIDLFSQPFMRPLPAMSADATLAAGMRINWDIQTLRQAEGLAESFLAFAPNEEAAPRSIQQQVRSVAGAEAAANIGLLVRLAARPAGDLSINGSRAILQDVSGLANALPVLVNLRNTLRQAGATATATAAALDALVSGQAIRLLRQVDGDLAAAAPYRLADPSLSFWHGSPPLAEPAFGASSPTDLASTLPPRRDFIEALARDYAAPLVSYLRDPGTSGNAGASGLVARWQSILNTLDRYHRSDAGNSLTGLEQFITVDMDKIDLSNCRQFNWGRGVGSDYFAQQLQVLRQAIASRCGSVVHTDTTDRYTSLSTTFNAQLAGRFPFAPTAAAYSTGLSPRLGGADPSEVRRFFVQYGPDLLTLQAQFESGGSRGAAGRAAEDFLTQLIGVQSAFAPMLADPSGNTPLSYQLDVEFFTNPGSAKSQNQVIEATVGTSAQRASSLNGTSRIVWTNGQPMRVRLRWAANAPMVPDPSARRSWPRINGLNADFDFAGNWSLLRLIATQAPGSADLNGLQDRQPEVLAFDVPLRRNPNSAVGGNTEFDMARIYLRLAVTGIVQAPGQPEKIMPLTLPDFPTAAPLLGRLASYMGPAFSTTRIGLANPDMRSVSQ